MNNLAKRLGRPAVSLASAARDLYIGCVSTSLRALWLALWLALGLVLTPSGCAAPGADIHVAPLYSRLSRASGGTETEALAGLWISQPSDGEGGEYVSRKGLRPLYSRGHTETGRVNMHFLAPLGYYTRDGEHATSLLFPLYYWHAYPDRDGSRSWDLVSLPGVLWSHRKHADDAFGWFPIYGNFKNVLTYEQVQFALFPLYVKSKRNGNTSWNFLFPIFGRTRGPTVHSTRFWPFYGRSRYRNAEHLPSRLNPMDRKFEEPYTAKRYDRWFVMWPFFHLHKDHLGGGNEKPATKWMLFPLFGATKRGSYRSYTALWPFFGYARDRERGFWAVDAPWPFVRLQGGGRAPLAEERTRFWPVYSKYKAAGMEAYTYMWPLAHQRLERYERSTRRSFYFVPFLQTWSRYDHETHEQSSWTKVWPIFQEYRNGDRARAAFPALSPLRRSPFLDFHYAWLWELFSVEERPGGISTRSWGALWRGEYGRERRRYFSALWSNRQYTSEQGEEVSETSLLFGLLRWRKIEGRGRDWMAPAFPGPGWPALEPKIP